MPNVCQQEVFDGVYRAHANALFHFIFYKCGNTAQAEDIVQEAYLKLWQNCRKVDVEKSRAYLFTVGRNLLLNQFEHQKVVLKFERRQAPVNELQTPESVLRQKELKTALEHAISTMPEGQREVFLMHRMDGFKYREIAELLGLSVKAVEKRMQKALEYLRKNVSDFSR